MNRKVGKKFLKILAQTTEAKPVLVLERENG